MKRQTLSKERNAGKDVTPIDKVMEEAESMKQIRKKEKDSRVYGLSLESCD
jgi:hypothetical protein